jgi:hypothetical protein
MTGVQRLLGQHPTGHSVGSEDDDLHSYAPP